jgi:hypothetical protein
LKTKEGSIVISIAVTIIIVFGLIGLVAAILQSVGSDLPRLRRPDPPPRSIENKAAEAIAAQRIARRSRQQHANMLLDDWEQRLALETGDDQIDNLLDRVLATPTGIVPAEKTEDWLVRKGNEHQNYYQPIDHATRHMIQHRYFPKEKPLIHR